MHTGQRNPLQLPEDEQYDRFSTQPFASKLVQILTKLLFHALNSSKIFAIFDYEDHPKLKVITPLIMFSKPYLLLFLTLSTLFRKLNALYFQLF